MSLKVVYSRQTTSCNLLRSQNLLMHRKKGVLWCNTLAKSLILENLRKYSIYSSGFINETISALKLNAVLCLEVNGQV